MHSATQNVSMGKRRRRKKNQREGDCKLLPYVHAPGCETKMETSCPFQTPGLKCFSNHDDTATLTWTSEFTDNYFTYNVVSECKLITTPVLGQRINNPFSCSVMTVFNGWPFESFLRLVWLHSIMLSLILEPNLPVMSLCHWWSLQKWSLTSRIK